MMHHLTSISGAAFIAVVVAFWVLFFAVVLVRLGDADVKVKGSRWSFLIVKWPAEELAAYKKLLRPKEHRRWYNWYLLNASSIAGWLLAAAIVSLALSLLGA